MKSLIGVVCTLLSANACVGERPTFGQAATSGTSVPDAGTTSDTSPDVSGAPDDVIAEPIQDKPGESDARVGTNTDGTDTTETKDGTNAAASTTDETDTADSDGADTGDTRTDEADTGDTRTDEADTGDTRTDETRTSESTADESDANSSTSDPEECPKNADPQRVCTSECPCDVGGGTCTDDDECESGLVCTPDAAPKLGFPGASCLPAHCVNDRQDQEETSVDCGGACGCRATYELVEMSGVPTDADSAWISAMSSDGGSFAGSVGRGRTGYPARISADGVVTELQGFSASGGTYDISNDGSVIVGSLSCEDPPSCSSFASRPYRWTGSADPDVMYTSGIARATSATGTVVAGEYYDAGLGRNAVFRAMSTQSSRFISALDSVNAMSADGQFIAGRLAATDDGAVWSHQQNALVSLNPLAAWSRWEIAAMNADGSAFAGTGYNATLETSHGYIWRDGEFSELPQLPDAEYTTPYAMNASGTVVTGTSGTNAHQRAFIWDEEQGIRRVLDEVAARGLELPVDLELANAEFLSDDGRIVVGRPIDASTSSFWRVTLLD